MEKTSVRHFRGEFLRGGAVGLILPRYVQSKMKIKSILVGLLFLFPRPSL
jgi:hypothetical protein